MTPLRRSPSHLCPGALAMRALLTVLLLLPAVLFGAPAPAQAISIFIDPGHGGIYSNANANGLKEKNVNLSIALYLRYYLRANGHRVLMARTTDRVVDTSDRATWQWGSDGLAYYYKDGRTGYVGGIPRDDLQARSDLANRAGAALFISVHNNGASSSRARGTETWAPRNDPLGQSLSAYVQRRVVGLTRLPGRGHFVSNFYVIRWANMPAMLDEGAFISNPVDASLLRSSWFRSRIAKGMAQGVQDWLATDPYRARYARVAAPAAAMTDVAVARAKWSAETTEVILFSRKSADEAMTLAPLVRKLDAPLLGVEATSVPEAVKGELGRLKPQRITIVGYPRSIGPEVIDQAAAAAGVPKTAVRTIGGADRYETAALVAREVGVPPSGIVVAANGDTGWGDPVAASAMAAKIGAPILLVSRDSTPAATRLFFEDNASSIKRTFVVGGSKAVSVAEMASLPAPTRFWGTDVFATNIAANRPGWWSASVAPAVVNVNKYPDVVAGAAFAAKARQPLLLTNNRVLPEELREYLENYGWRVGPYTMIGSTGSLSTLMELEIAKAEY